MSTLPTSDEMSWLLSSPGSVLVIATWRSTDGWMRTTREARQVAAEFLQALHRPRRHDAVEIAARNAVVRLQHRAEPLRREQAERRFVDRRSLDRVDGVLLHHRLQPFGDRRLAAAHRPQQIQDLLPLLESLRRVLEERDDLLDRVLHAVELAERRIAPDDAVAEDSPEVRVVAGVDLLGFADARQHPLGGGRIGGRFPLAQLEVVLETHFLVLRGRVIRPEFVEQRRHRRHPKRRFSEMPDSRGRSIPLPAHGAVHLLGLLANCTSQRCESARHSKGVAAATGNGIGPCAALAATALAGLPIQETARNLYCISRARHGAPRPSRVAHGASGALRTRVGAVKPCLPQGAARRPPRPGRGQKWGKGLPIFVTGSAVCGSSAHAFAAGQGTRCRRNVFVPAQVDPQGVPE